MYSLRAQSLQKISHNLGVYALNYNPKGAAEERRCPPGYRSNHFERILGQGDTVFKRAKNILMHFDHLELDWVDHLTPKKLAKGRYIGSQTRYFGIYGIAFSQILKVIDKPQSFGYIIGTTDCHVLKGEEMFLVETGEEGTVTMTIFSYSKPNSLLSRLGLPFIYLLQRRFVKDVTLMTKQMIEKWN